MNKVKKWPFQIPNTQLITFFDHVKCNLRDRLFYYTSILCVYFRMIPALHGINAVVISSSLPSLSRTLPASNPHWPVLLCPVLTVSLHLF